MVEFNKSDLRHAVEICREQQGLSQQAASLRSLVVGVETELTQSIQSTLGQPIEDPVAYGHGLRIGRELRTR